MYLPYAITRVVEDILNSIQPFEHSNNSTVQQFEHPRTARCCKSIMSPGYGSGRPGCFYASITPLSPSSSKAVDLWYYLTCMVMKKRWQHSLRPSIHWSQLKSCFMYSVERQFSKTPFTILFPRQARCQFRLVKTYSKSFIADRMCSLPCTLTNQQSRGARKPSLSGIQRLVLGIPLVPF